MNGRVRRRFWVEAASAAVALALAILDALWPEWLADLTGADPDLSVVSVEWMLPFGLMAVAAASGLIALWEWGRDRRTWTD